MSKVFLGGTCNKSTWRNVLTDMLTIEYFNPVVEDWNEECQAIEIDEKENKCDVHLYVITKEMKGVFSIAEAVDSVHNEKVKTIFQVAPHGFDKAELKSLQAVIDLINSRGGIAYMDDTLNKTADLLNKELPNKTTPPELM